MRLAGLLGTLALAAGGLTVTTLPRPAFPGPAGAPSGPHRLVLASSRQVGVSTGEPKSIDEVDPFRGLPPTMGFDTVNRLFVVYGKDGSTGRYLLAYDRGGHGLYGFDLKNYAWPPRIKPGDREFVYEQPVWAQEAGGVLYVETAHSTYASSSYGQNGYITAIDLKTRRAIWRSPALVANAGTFLVAGRYLVTGYGFTDEPDYLYLLDRSTGKVVDRLLLPNAPETITRAGALIHVRTYDHAVVVRLRGA
jgi:hypothetical protein